MAAGQRGRSGALDQWDYRRPFAPFHIQWNEAEVTPAFEQKQAYAIALQDLKLHKLMDIWAHREVLVTFSSEHIQVNNAPAFQEPGWVVLLAGQKLASSMTGGVLSKIDVGGGAVVQALIHARSGELVLGTALPVRFTGQRE